MVDVQNLLILTNQVDASLFVYIFMAVDGCVPWSLDGADFIATL